MKEGSEDCQIISLASSLLAQLSDYCDEGMDQNRCIYISEILMVY